MPVASPIQPSSRSASSAGAKRTPEETSSSSRSESRWLIQDLRTSVTIVSSMPSELGRISTPRVNPILPSRETTNSKPSSPRSIARMPRPRHSRSEFTSDAVPKQRSEIRLAVTPATEVTSRTRSTIRQGTAHASTSMCESVASRTM